MTTYRVVQHWVGQSPGWTVEWSEGDKQFPQGHFHTQEEAQAEADRLTRLEDEKGRE